MRKNICSLVVVLSMSVGLTVSVLADGADFSGKKIDWLVPFGKGGGTDTWARFLLPMVAENLPGHPEVEINNVPGEGSITGANQFNASAQNNGLEVFGSTASTLFYYLLNDNRVEYDPKEWIPVFATPMDGVLYISPDLGVKSAADLLKLQHKKLVFPSLAPTSLDLLALLSMDLLGLHVKPVFGMDRADGRKAFERGEVNVDYQNTSAYLQKVVPLVKAGKAIPIMTWGVMGDDGKMHRDPSFPDLPHFAEVYEMLYGPKMLRRGQAFDVWRTFFVAGYAAQKFIFLPKGTPDDIVATWRKSMSDMAASEDFKSEAAKNIGSYDQVVGSQVEDAFNMIVDVPKFNKIWIKAWLSDRYDVNF